MSKNKDPMAGIEGKMINGVPLSIVRQREGEWKDPDPDSVVAFPDTRPVSSFRVERDSISTAEIIKSLRSHARYDGSEVATVEVLSSGELRSVIICFPRVLGRDGLEIPPCIQRIMWGLKPDGLIPLSFDWEDGYIELGGLRNEDISLSFISEYRAIGKLLDMCKDNHE